MDDPDHASFPSRSNMLYEQNPGLLSSVAGSAWGAGGYIPISIWMTVQRIKALLTEQKAAEWLAESSGMEAVGKTERC